MWVINVCIEKYFDKINHELLLRKLDEYLNQLLIEKFVSNLCKGNYDIN